MESNKKFIGITVKDCQLNKLYSAIGAVEGAQIVCLTEARNPSAFMKNKKTTKSNPLIRCFTKLFTKETEL